MASNNSVVAKTAANIDRVKQEINLFKAQITQIATPTAAPETRNAARELLNHVKASEINLEKAEAKVQRLRPIGRVLSRPTVPVPASERAKRALTILNAADPSLAHGRSVRQKTARPRYLTLAGKKPATPIREEDLPALLKRTSQLVSTNITILKTSAVTLDWRHIFSACIWFKEVPAPKDAQPKPGGKSPVYVVPEHIACFRTDENASRWSCSDHAVFNVMTERAQAAIRYFMAREETGEDAFVELILWLVKHHNIFSAKCDDRRLAFDASRGIFLPPCVHPFDGSGPARFTRGTIPVRNTSTQQSRLAHPSQQQSGTHAAAGHPSHLPRVDPRAHPPRPRE
ncbi:hypothetical protein BWQ96_01845 [Gracilariopsis chorda]|uniref:Uncharacterized protein n=1 Tax=Gracilariopsis chorda TaxID=448386 RepID=A0A2V3J202_9FLOR|nr:hypothetical protein BWQ96_01845 [Gracilariopsis chorda]|eukprot:PXF48385.1 hypothetical protein BWQ96_01845 [Gracilariopsis chorda]